MQLDHQSWISGVHPLQQRCELRSDDVVADTDHQPPVFGRERPDRRLMRGNQVARRAEEGGADYFDINLDRAPKEGAELALDEIVLVARSISGGRVNVVGLRLPEEDEVVVPQTRMQTVRRKLADIWASVAGV